MENIYTFMCNKRRKTNILGRKTINKKTRNKKNDLKIDILKLTPKKYKQV